MSWSYRLATRCMARRKLFSEASISPIGPACSSNMNESSLCHKSCRAMTTSGWREVVTEAEKIVGYPTSYLSLRYLFSDEVSNIALHLRKLVGSSHPILKTAKKLVSDSHSSVNPRGLIILLVSQIGNEMTKSSPEQIQETLRRQRSLAEIAEMINTVQLIHTGLINGAVNKNSSCDLPPDLEFGNKISILSGDYLLANASMELAKLQNTKVVELIAEAIQNFTKSEFMRNQNNLADKVSKGITEWEERNYLGSASLLEKSCQSVLELAGLGSEMQSIAAEFGKNIGLAWQVQLQLDKLIGNDKPTENIEIDSAPVLFHLMENKALVPNFELLSGNSISQETKQELKNGCGVKRANELGYTYASRGQELLSSFPKSEALEALLKIVNELKCRFSGL